MMPALQVEVQTEGGFPLVAPASSEEAARAEEYDDDESDGGRMERRERQRGVHVHRLIDEDADDDGDGDAGGDDGHGAVAGDDDDEGDSDGDGDGDGGTIRARHHPASEADDEAAAGPSSATGDGDDVTPSSAATPLSPPPPPRDPPPDDDGWTWQLHRRFDRHWRTSHSFEGAVLGLAASSPHGAASIIKVMTVCNLGSLLFFVHTSLWYVEEMRKAQDRGGLGGGSVFGGGGDDGPDIPSTQDLIDFSSSAGGSTRSFGLVLSAIWRVLLLGPADGYAGGDTVSSRGGGSSLDTRMIWSWLVAQMFVGFVKLLLRLVTMYQCDLVLSLSPNTTSGGDVPPSTPLLSSIMVDRGRRTEGTMTGVELERERSDDGGRRLPWTEGRWTEGRRLLREAEARREREQDAMMQQRRRLNRVVGGLPFRAHAAVGRAAQILVAFGFVLYLVRGSRRPLLSSDCRQGGASAASVKLWSSPDAILKPSPFDGPEMLDTKRSDNIVALNLCVSAANVLGFGVYCDQGRNVASPQLPRGGLSCSVFLPAVVGETEYSVETLENRVLAIAGTFFTPYCGAADCCYHDVHIGVACWWELEDSPSSPHRIDFFAAPPPWTGVDDGGGGDEEGAATGRAAGAASAEAEEEAINSAVLLDVCCTNLIVCLFRALMALGVVHFHVVQERRAVHRRRLAMRRERRGLLPDEIGTMESAVFGWEDDAGGGGAREDVVGGGDEVGVGVGTSTSTSTGTTTAEDERNDWRFGVEEDRGVCSICLECYRTGDRLTVLPCDGRHRFHAGCIREWLVKCSTCPLCQGNLRSIMNISSSSSSDYSVR